MVKMVFYTMEVKRSFKKKVKEIIADTGTHGLIIGADCTIPSDISLERIAWVVKQQFYKK